MSSIIAATIINVFSQMRRGGVLHTFLHVCKVVIFLSKCTVLPECFNYKSTLSTSNNFELKLKVIECWPNSYCV